MKHETVATGKRKPVNLSLDTGIVQAAREAGINLSQVADRALAAEVKKERERRWKEENRESIEAWNRWIEKNGLPLETYRAW